LSDLHSPWNSHLPLLQTKPSGQSLSATQSPGQSDEVPSGFTHFSPAWHAGSAQQVFRDAEGLHEA
jgi:hypothetical protein